MANILVVRFSAIGDVAMTVPVIDSLARQYPNNTYTVASQSFLKPLFAYCPSNVHFFGVNLKKEHKGVLGIYRIYRELSKQKFDAVADLHDVLRTKLLRFFFGFSGLKVRHINKGRNEKQQLTRKNNKLLRQLKPTIERYTDVFKELGQPIDNLTPHPPLRSRGGEEKVSLIDNIILNSVTRGCLISPQITQINAETKNYSADYQENNLCKSAKICGKSTYETAALNTLLIGIAPFAKHQGKIFPLDRMKQVVAYFANKPDATLFLFGGGADEIAILNKWSEKYPQTNNVAGKMDLSSELVLISKLDVMLSMDSANMHLASLTGTPVVSVWGATHPYLGFYGYNQSLDNAVQIELQCRPCSVYGNKPCHRNDAECMSKITPKIVIDKIENVVKKAINKK